MKRQSRFSSSSSSSKKKVKLPPPPTAAPPKPVPDFNPLRRGPRNERHHNQERIFVHHSNNTVRPKILFVRDDGEVETQMTALPSSGAHLELVGQSRDKVCFLNHSANTLGIWDLKKQRMEQHVAVDMGVPAALGFGHTRNGDLKIVRLIIPPIVPTDRVYTLEICREDPEERKLVWFKREVIPAVSFHLAQGFAKLVCEGEDRFLFWKGGYASATHIHQIIKFDLERESLGYVEVPPDDSLRHENMCIGHGFQGRLALSVYVPSSSEEPFSMLRVWTLERNDGGNNIFWHRLLTLPMEASCLLEPFVPLSFFYGRGDSGVNFLFHRNNNEVFHIVLRGDEVVSAPITIPAFTYRQGPFVGRQFQATRLRPKISFILEPSLPKVEEDKPMRWDPSLSFADDTE
ncbi:hypothetical protein ACLB2K_057783 [Fragaria x ananassa]